MATLVTWSKHLKICCHVVLHNKDRKIPSMFGHALKEAITSELQTHHCMASKQCTWLLCCVCVIPANELSLQKLNQVIAFDFRFSRKFWFLIPISSWEANARFPPPADVHVSQKRIHFIPQKQQIVVGWCNDL